MISRPFRGNRRRVIALYAAILMIAAATAAVFLGRHQTVEWQWRSHERQLRDALESGDGRDITEAIIFFENATGVTSAAVADEAGTRTAVPSLEAEMREWEAWYATHKACLAWDIAEQRLELRKGCDP